MKKKLLANVHKSRICFILIAFIYILIGISSIQSYKNKTLLTRYTLYNKIGSSSHYNKLALALLSGKLNIVEDLPKKFLSLKDKYNPQLNAYYRSTIPLQDYTFSNGRLFVYFGPVPCLLFYIPYHFITNKNLPDRIVVLIFCLLSLLFIFKITRFLINKFFININSLNYMFCLILVGLCNLSLFLMWRPATYEVAITGGACFLLGGIYFLYKSLDQINFMYSIKQLLLASILFGLSIGCRFHQLISCLFLLVFSCITLNKKFDSKKNYLIFIATLPFFVSLLLLLIYNYCRFNSYFDFGLLNMLTSVDHHKVKIFSISYSLQNVFFMLFSTLNINKFYPFIHLGLNGSPMFGFEEFKNNTYTPERFSGLLYILPISILILPIINKIISRIFTDKALLIYILILVTPVITNFLIISMYYNISLRYFVDFSSLLLILLNLLFLYFTKNKILFDKISSFFITYAYYILGIISIFFNISFALETKY